MSISRWNSWYNQVAGDPVKARAIAAIEGLLDPTIHTSPDTEPGARPSGLQHWLHFGQPTLIAAQAARPEGLAMEDWLRFVGRTLTVDPVYAHLDPGTINVWILSGLFAKGIKLFAPTALEFESLSRVQLRVPFGVYRQPFESMAILIPDDLLPQAVNDQIGRPLVAILRFKQTKATLPDGTVRDAGILCCMIPGDFPDRPGGPVAKVELSWRMVWADPDEMIESRLEWIEDETEAGRTFRGLNTAENEVSGMIKRAVLNCCLLLSQTSTRCLGPVNAAYHAKLSASLKKKNLPASVRAANVNALKAIPVMYGFDQSTKVYDTAPALKAGDPVPTGVKMSPHWRRGHWARQHYGVGNLMVKLVFRPAVLVNEQYLFGGLPKTRAVYQLDKTVSQQITNSGGSVPPGSPVTGSGS